MQHLPAYEVSDSFCSNKLTQTHNAISDGTLNYLSSCESSFIYSDYKTSKSDSTFDSFFSKSSPLNNIYLAHFVPSNSAIVQQDSNVEVIQHERASPLGKDAISTTDLNDQKDKLIWDYAADLALHPKNSKTQPNLSSISQNILVKSRTSFLSHRMISKNDCVIYSDHREKIDGKSIPSSEEDDQNQSLFTMAPTVSSTDAWAWHDNSFEEKLKFKMPQTPLGVNENILQKHTFVSSPDLCDLNFNMSANFNTAIQHAKDSSQGPKKLELSHIDDSIISNLSISSQRSVSKKETKPSKIVPGHITSSQSTASLSADTSTARFVLEHPDIRIFSSKLSEMTVEPQNSPITIASSREISDISTTVMEEEMLDCCITRDLQKAKLFSASCPCLCVDNVHLIKEPQEEIVDCFECKRFYNEHNSNIHFSCSPSITESQDQDFKLNQMFDQPENRSLNQEILSTCSQFTLTETLITTPRPIPSHSKYLSDYENDQETIKQLLGLLKSATGCCKSLLRNSLTSGRINCDLEIEKNKKALNDLNSRLNNYYNQLVQMKVSTDAFPRERVISRPSTSLLPSLNKTQRTRSRFQDNLVEYESIIMKPYIPHQKELQQAFQSKMCSFVQRSAARLENIKLEVNRSAQTKPLPKRPITVSTVTERRLYELQSRRLRMKAYGNKIKDAVLTNREFVVPKQPRQKHRWCF